VIRLIAICNITILLPVMQFCFKDAGARTNRILNWIWSMYEKIEQELLDIYKRFLRVVPLTIVNKREYDFSVQELPGGHKFIWRVYLYLHLPHYSVSWNVVSFVVILHVSHTGNVKGSNYKIRGSLLCLSCGIHLPLEGSTAAEPLRGSNCEEEAFMWPLCLCNCCL